MEGDLRQLTSKQMYNGITLITLHVSDNLLAHWWAPLFVSKGSIYRIGVVLKTKTKLYFCRMCCAIPYFQN